MANAYANLRAIKSVSLLDIAGTSHDRRLLALLEQVSRWIDQHCNRHFYTLLATRTFDGTGGSGLLTPDLISLASLKSDADGDGEFETLWAADDYLLYPLNAEPSQPWGRPYTRLEASRAGSGPRRFPAGQGRVQAQGRWGYREELYTLSATIDSGGVTPSAASFGVDDGRQVSGGDTLLIGAEQVYVTAVSINSLTVVRGVNGAMAARHDASSAVQVYRYPASIAEACLLQAANLWRRGAGASASASDGGLDPEVRLMLSPYRRPPV